MTDSTDDPAKETFESVLEEARACGFRLSLMDEIREGEWRACWARDYIGQSGDEFWSVAFTSSAPVHAMRCALNMAKASGDGR